MAIFDNNPIQSLFAPVQSGIGNLFEGMTPFGSTIPGGILEKQDEDKLRNQALFQGLLGTAATYLATPKNLNTGSALPYLGKAFLGGQGPATFAGGGGSDTSLLGGLKRGVSGIMPGDVLMSNPVGYGNLALNAYGTMNQSQAPLQPSPMLSAQQLISGQSPVPTPQFNSLLQPSRRQILIG